MTVKSSSVHVQCFFKFENQNVVSGESMDQHPLPSRQVHLDFHTSPLIQDVLCEWDAEAFADTMVRAHVNSVTVFAKCHHGLSYYPTEIGASHPHMGSRDLLGEQIRALQARGIAAPIYYTVGWDERLAHLHPEWRQVQHDGLSPRAADHPGAWWFLSYLHPEYLEHMRRELREIMARYPVEGIFFDIVFAHHNAGFEEHARTIRRDHGIARFTLEHQQHWNALSKRLFAEAMTPLVLEHHPQARVFYNSAHTFSVDSRHGLRGVNQVQTHWEIESLPSGFWGYHHFPRFARHVIGFGLPWLGMTGRFQRMWGDFGGIKPQAALEYECFRTQAHGGANSVGDQLPPRGQLDPAAYELIGAVYAQCKVAEEFYEGSSSRFDVGLMLASHASVPASHASQVEEGAVLALEEMHYNPAVLDDASDLEPFKLVILTDTTVITKTLRDKLEAYHANGGKLLISHRGGMDENGTWALDFLPVQYQGELEIKPTYWRTSPEFWLEAHRSDRVFYEPGLNFSCLPGAWILVDRVLPYFERTDTHFMSHLQAPPVQDVHPHPAVIAGERFVIFADPIFAAYRQTGSSFLRDVLERAIHKLIGLPSVGHGLARSVLCVPRQRGQDLIVTLLHYIPQRKALDGDVLEKASSFAGEILRIPGATRARLFQGADLERLEPGEFVLPISRGRLLIEVLESK
jgi:Hypothetical glycosyl hydrolase 6